MTGEHDGYRVGYGKPPKNTRFRKGQSGNPGGRPRGSRNKYTGELVLTEIVRNEANRHVPVNDGNRPTSMTMGQAVVRSIAVNAARGMIGAQKLFVRMMAKVQQRDEQVYKDFLEAAIEYKVGAERMISRYREAGLEPPVIYPHPDDIEIDFETGEVSVTGPMTRQEAEQSEAEEAEVRQAYRMARSMLETASTREEKETASGLLETLEERFPGIVAGLD